MDPVRFGRGIRALRQRRGWRQEDLARAAGVSRAAVWRIERGRAPGVTVAMLERVAAAAGARVVVRLDWNGEELDRLLDGDHAALVEAVVARLRGAGWSCATEATFNVYGERGSVDVLAYQPDARAILVVEVKTIVPDVGPMLATLDRKARLAPRLGGDRGWSATTVSRLLVVREGPTARRHVARMSETFETAFPVRGIAVRRWVDRPVGAIAGLLFLSSARHASGIKRIRRPRASAPHGSSPSSSQPLAEGRRPEGIAG